MIGSGGHHAGARGSHGGAGETLIMTLKVQMMEKQKRMMTRTIKCLVIQQADLIVPENLWVALDLKNHIDPLDHWLMSPILLVKDNEDAES